MSQPEAPARARLAQWLPAETAPVLRLSGVSRVYGRGATAVHALRRVDLEVRAGEFVVVLGPSGSGKTTLLNLVGGLEPPSAGRVLVEGRDVGALDGAGRAEYRRHRVGFVFQFFNLVPTLTAAENVQLIAELTGGEAEARTARVLDQVGLTEHAGRYPAQLSGGEQQRVAIARAVVKEPPLLLCDEPTGSLDLPTGRRALQVLQELAEEGHHTVILVTHNSAIARMATSVVRMRSGEVVERTAVPERVPAGELEW